jgi:hypothetical protein
VNAPTLAFEKRSPLYGSITSSPVIAFSYVKCAHDFLHFLCGTRCSSDPRDCACSVHCINAIPKLPALGDDRYRPGDYETWKYIAPVQKAAWLHKTFEHGTWGGELRREFEPQPGHVVALEHWCSSGFANTDLDLQLKKHGIHKLIVIGLIAHTCVEATVRFAAELGYDVTLVKDATADYSDEEMHAALDVNLP